MPQRISLTVGRGVGLLAVVATIVAGDAAWAQTGSAASAQAAGLSPILRNVLAQALSREEAANKGNPVPSGYPPGSFPLPTCLFKDGLCGAINRDGSIAVEPRFDFVDEFHEGRAVVKLNGRYGYVDTEGHLVVEPQYASAFPFKQGLAQAESAYGGTALIDRTGARVLEPHYLHVIPFADEVFWADGALVDRRGAWIVTGITNFAPFDPDHRDVMWVFRRKDQRWGLIRPDGTWLVEPIYQLKEPLHEDLAAVRQDGRVGYIDRTGRIVIPATFEAGGSFANGLAPVKQGGRFGYIDHAGAFVIPPNFEQAVPFEGTTAQAQLGGLYGRIDRSGAWVTEPVYDRMGPLLSGHIVVQRGEKVGVLDPSGHVLVDPQFDPSAPKPAGHFFLLDFTIFGSTSTVPINVSFGPMFCADGRIVGLIDRKIRVFAADGTPLRLAWGEIWESAKETPCHTPLVVKDGDRFGYVDAQLRPIAEPRFESAGVFADGLAVVKLGGKYGLLRADGTWALEPQYDAVMPLDTNKALGKLGDRAGLIDLATGGWITQSSYDDVCALGHGLVGVMIDGKMGAIDEAENWLFPPSFEPWTFNFAEGLTPVRVDGKWGFIDAAGVAIAPQFDAVSEFAAGTSWAKQGDEWCIIDRHGAKVSSLACQTKLPRAAKLAQASTCQIPRQVSQGLLPRFQAH